MKGRVFSESAKKNMGRKPGFASPMKGVPRALEVRKKISEAVRKTARRGSDANGYIDGKGLERRGERNSDKAKRWRYDVMARDGWICVHCGDDSGGNLNAHHVLSWARHPEKRFDVDNGKTLCEPCHWLVHRHNIPGF
jgi:predicted HNH restriction endonuclease